MLFVEKLVWSRLYIAMTFERRFLTKYVTKLSRQHKRFYLSLSFSLLTCLYLSWILIQLIFFLSGDLCIVLLSCDTETFFLYFYFQTSLLICIREISLRVGSRGLFGNSMYICANLDVRENYQWSLLSIVFIFLV